MSRCTLLIPDAGPINSLWVADKLSLLLKLDMLIVVVDAVFDELTRDPANWPKDKAVKEFIEGNQPPFIIESTNTGRVERAAIAKGAKPRKNTGEVAIADFMSAPDGLCKYLAENEPVVVLFEDADIPFVRFLKRPQNLHLLSTAGMMRGLERCRIIPSADDVIREMTAPSNADRRPRIFTDLPDGFDEPASVGSSWEP